ncbi:hypothetical protein Kpol_1048p10 [Vanderwaltozyma polyspora DSM 70294]|uniref:diacylglycerol cholinephosphotransferase n=1 Tax=Vanderwaltozyma polyspora (strain ATCC 22028 / DSM 70294 / BCRC 21397 / CBS 2163 / NBRC 10782 / NRRL Y-8283 / UCD 57-17) TaxID=436907 RepID=A7TGH3_VANPO|nr:uncharacterized protein Kpol_1048p10 [Vanderwaltozyma polyspora DSM 70294]EDO18580.1 hypothetical protein Kpol_1048p10 [Vanderwaltozyma polyspora DSM 70294]
MGFFVPYSSLSSLKEYKYQSEDRSLVTKYVLKPYWQKFAPIFPAWMAPNVVTLLGFAFIVINFITVLIVDPTLTQGSPGWAYLSYAIGIFFYQTFDACDGIHARRTGQSGPLGELFDHCIDSINTTLSLIPFCSASRTGYTVLLILSQFTLLLNFYLSTWEEFHTHKLFLSEFSGPVEGILIIAAIFVLSAIYGDEAVWHYNLCTIPIGSEPFNVEFIHFVFVFCTLGLLFNTLSARRNVITYYRASTPDKNTCDAKVDAAMKGLLPFFVFFFSVFTVIIVEPSFITLPFVLTIGLTAAFVVGRIIVSHLTKQPFPMLNLPMFIPSVQLIFYNVAVFILRKDPEEVVKALVWLGLGISFGTHALFINEIIFEFTSYLDVYALSIKHPKKA